MLRWFSSHPMTHADLEQHLQRLAAHGNPQAIEAAFDYLAPIERLARSGAPLSQENIQNAIQHFTCCAAILASNEANFRKPKHGGF